MDGGTERNAMGGSIRSMNTGNKTTALTAFLKKVFEVPDSYRKRVNRFGKADAFLAIALFVSYCIAMAFSGILVSCVSSDLITHIGSLINLAFVGIVLVILKIRKQGLDTIGLCKGNWKLSLGMGIPLAAILFFCNCLSNILWENQTFLPLKEILVYIFYFFTVGLAEEVMFRGFIETRLHGCTKSIILDVLLTGILFLLMHFPFRMVAYRMSFRQLITNVPYMLDLFVTHLILSCIRIKSDSLYGAILPHWISDLAYRIVTHT